MKKEPMILRPAYKDYLWGGDRLKSEFNKETDISPLAESWECSVHPSGESIIANGDFSGMSLKEVLEKHPDFMGTHPDRKFGFPILVKLIDARSKLSVQVHPDDEYALANENGEHGKIEMWYVLDAAPGSEVIYGFSHDTDEVKIRRSIEKGNIEKYLNKVKVRKDDVLLVKPGMVHAIGDGVLIAEIQESSDLTYRLFDYDRTDINGKKRELHIDKAMETLSFERTGSPRQPLRVLRYKNGCATEFLCRCKYFEVHRMLINTVESDLSFVDYSSDELSFRILLCIEGDAEMQSESIKKGDCVFIPAGTDFRIKGKAEFLDIRA
ncbi:MAG: class I mannose-6-phosphate isomerase [Lachnospiraceae bacterium]|nr:class I mannose-6-phosphate isomerase [Lachnospiraceae bacterium]